MKGKKKEVEDQLQILKTNIQDVEDQVQTMKVVLKSAEEGKKKVEAEAIDFFFFCPDSRCLRCGLY